MFCAKYFKYLVLILSGCGIDKLNISKTLYKMVALWPECNYPTQGEFFSTFLRHSRRECPVRTAEAN